jgi:hypothetical protein
VLKPNKFRRILGITAEIDDHHLATLQLREPVDAPSQHFNLIGDSGLHCGRGCWASCGHFTVGWVVAYTQVRQPRRNLAGFGILGQLMDAAAAQASRGGDLPDGETGVRRGDDGPDTLWFGLMQTRCRYAQAFFGLLFALEALAVFFSGFHAPRIRVYGSRVQQIGRNSVLGFFPQAVPFTTQTRLTFT